MQIKSVKLSNYTPLKTLILILGSYFFVILPCIQIFFRENPWLFKHGDVIYFFLVVLLMSYRNNLEIIGFSTRYLRQHLILGTIMGGTILISLPLLDTAIEVTGLADHELFGKRSKKEVLHDFSSLIEKGAVVFFIPLIEQIFFTGIILKTLLRRINPVLAIYAAGLFYTLAGFKLSLGTFGLGVCTGLLFKLTGTLYSPVLFHMSCALAGIILEKVYPRLIFILGFLL